MHGGWRGQLRLEAEKRAKRLHVSNLPEGFTESKVTEFLNSAMKAAGLATSKVRRVVLFVFGRLLRCASVRARGAALGRGRART